MRQSPLTSQELAEVASMRRRWRRHGRRHRSVERVDRLRVEEPEPADPKVVLKCLIGWLALSITGLLVWSFLHEIVLFITLAFRALAYGAMVAIHYIWVFIQWMSS